MAAPNLSLTAPPRSNRFFLAPLTAGDPYVELSIGEPVPIGRRFPPSQALMQNLHISREQVKFYMKVDRYGRVLILMRSVRNWRDELLPKFGGFWNAEEAQGTQRINGRNITRRVYRRDI